MKSPSFKVLITTSGVGVPLGEITDYTNKSLIKVGKKPTLSYILESYPEETEFVITVGHYAEQVKAFIQMVYPALKVRFVEIDPYEGEGSSLAYSMLCAAPYLQCPFVYHASDTIVTELIPAPDLNWMAGFEAQGSSKYASFDVLDGKVIHVYDKGNIQPDFLHIGLVGIHDHEKFWDTLRALHAERPHDQGLGDLHAIQSLVGQHVPFNVVEFHTWYDVGNVDSLNKVRLEIADSFHILDKLEESIFVFDDFVVKFFHDAELVQQRAERGRLLAGLVPEIEAVAENFYRYRFVSGRLFSKVATPSNFQEFLDWANARLWKPTQEVSADDFKAVCHDFYHTKTVKRVQSFLTSRSMEDGVHVINDEPVPSIESLLASVDFDWLCATEQTTFHGDFILDNILKTDEGFCLLDWRQNFGGLLESGDRYYDFAKLNHNLTINHGIINDNLFTISLQGETVTCDILRKENLVQCQAVLWDFLASRGYDVKKVKVLTALVWLNMSPLHHHPFDLFLFYFGKLNLWKALNS